MSQKIVVPMRDSGQLDTSTNPVLGSGQGSTELLNVGDLYRDGMVGLLPGYEPYNGVSGPLVADYTTGTVTVANGSKLVTGSGSSWTDANGLGTNAFAGDFFIGPDGAYYPIERVHNATTLYLKHEYAGASAAGGSYTIRSRVWMLAPFAASSGTVETTRTVDLVNVTTGTLTGCETGTLGVSITPDANVWCKRDTGGNGGYQGVRTGGGGSTVTKVGFPFYPTANTDCAGIILSIAAADIRTSGAGYWPTIDETTPDSYDPATSPGGPLGFKIAIYSDSAGNPSAVVHANAITAECTAGGEGLDAYFPFTGAFSLTGGTKYWLVIEKSGAEWFTGAGTVYSYVGIYCSTHPAVDGTTVTQGLDVTSYPASKGLVGSTWSTSYVYSYIDAGASPHLPAFRLVTYPATGTQTYRTDSISLGFTPTANGTLSINSANTTLNEQWVHDWGAERVYVDGTIDNSPNAMTSGSSWTWGLEYSDDASAWTVVDNSLAVPKASSLLPYSVTDKHPYYRVTVTLDSTSGTATPLLTAISMTFESPITGALETNQFTLVGSARKIFKQVSASAGTISTTENPGGIPAGWDAYQRKIFWCTGGQPPKYWDGIAAAADTVANLPLVAGGAGVDPPYRCDSVVTHNDKMIWHRNAQQFYPAGVAAERASTNTENTLIDLTAAGFPATTSAYAGYRVYPDVVNHPLRWWVITSNDTDTVTAAGATMSDVAVDGDYFLVTKNYRTTAWYGTAADPGDTPSLNTLLFGDTGGIYIQRAVSWKGRLIVLTNKDVWRVTGYGPTTPWEKEIIAQDCGTLSPWSVVAAGDYIYYWGTEGIYACSGSYGKPDIVSDRIRSLVLDDLNEAAREEIVGCAYKGLVYWSYPSGTSRVNNKTLVFNPTTGAWAQRNFGMYAPVSVVEEGQEEVMLFHDPTTGKICQYDSGWLISGNPQSLAWKMAYVTPSAPAEHAQYLYVRAVVDSEADATVAVRYALDYKDSWSSAGSLVPVDSSVTGRIGVSSSDRIYICRLPAAASGAAIALEFTSSCTDEIKFLSVDVVADPVESQTYG